MALLTDFSAGPGSLSVSLLTHLRVSPALRLYQGQHADVTLAPYEMFIPQTLACEPFPSQCRALKGGSLESVPVLWVAPCRWPRPWVAAAATCEQALRGGGGGLLLDVPSLSSGLPLEAGPRRRECGGLGEWLFQLSCLAAWNETEKDPRKQISWQSLTVLLKSSRCVLWV